MGLMYIAEPALSLVDKKDPVLGWWTEPALSLVDKKNPLWGLVDKAEPVLGLVDKKDPLLGLVDKAEPVLDLLDKKDPALTRVYIREGGQGNKTTIKITSLPVQYCLCFVTYIRRVHSKTHHYKQQYLTLFTNPLRTF